VRKGAGGGLRVGEGETGGEAVPAWAKLGGEGQDGRQLRAPTRVGGLGRGRLTSPSRAKSVASSGARRTSQWGGARVGAWSR